MESYLLAFPDLCTGCNRCALVCSSVKENIFIPSKSRIKVSNFAVDGYSVPHVCFQCTKPDCLEACPEGAIYRNNEDVVLVDNDKCTGCGECVDACPYGMIKVNGQNLAYKCDYCGGDPACVKECEPGAIAFLVPNKTQMKQRNFQMKQRVETVSPEEKRITAAAKIFENVRSRIPDAL